MNKGKYKNNLVVWYRISRTRGMKEIRIFCASGFQTFSRNIFPFCKTNLQYRILIKTYIFTVFASTSFLSDELKIK